jgi:hypothetical protein
MWSPQETVSQIADAMGQMSEIHVWVGVVEPPQLIDLSTGGLMADFRAKLDLEWLADPPPDYLWCDGRLPPAAIYEPCFSATWYALSKIWGCYQPEYARCVGDAMAKGLTLEKVLEYEKRENCNVPAASL